MKHTLLAAVAVAALAATATAQFPFQGFLYNFDRPQLFSGGSFVLRFGINAEQEICRIDRDDYRDWGLNSAGQTQIQGFMLWIQDGNDQTAQTFSVVGYNEDTNQLNFPLLTPPVMNITGVPLPPPAPPPGGGVLWRLGFNLTAPVAFAANQDIFLGVGLPAMTNPATNDGLWIGAVGNDNTQTVYDRPGPRGALGGGIFSDDYVCYVINGAAQYLPPTANGLTQLAIDWNHSGGSAGGVALAETNQVNYVSSNAPNGTANFLSGVHPDINGLNPGRADNIGFAVTTHTTQVAIGQPVFVLMALGPNPLGSTPITSFPPAAGPGSTGNVCLDFTSSATFLGFLAAPRTNGITGMAEMQIMINLTATARSVINSIPGNVDLWWQGFALDASAGGPPFEVRTTGCVIQKLK